MRHALLTAFALFLAVVRAANIEHEPRTMERIDGVDESEDESHDLHAAAPTFPASKTISHHQDLGMLEAPKESELTLDSNKESDADNDCDGRDSSDDNDLIIECESVFSGELGVDANYDDIDEESSVVDPEEFAQKQLERKTRSAGKHEGPAFIDPLTFAEFRGNSGLLSSFNFSDAETGCNLLDSTYSAQSTCDFDSLEGIESRQRSMSVFINPLPKFVQHLLDENCLDADSSQIGTVYSSRVCTPKEQELDTVILPTGSKLNMEWVQTVLVERLLESNCIFHRVDADWILAEVTSCFEAEKTIHDIDLSPGQKLVLVGDIHGQLEDLTGILKKHGYPSSTIVYLLNGDLVDRGLRSMECILLVFLLKLLCPFSVFITRGNHESYTVGIDSFYNECLLKYDCTSAFWHECHDVFAHLPLGYVVQGKIFVRIRLCLDILGSNLRVTLPFPFHSGAISRFVMGDCSRTCTLIGCAILSVHVFLPISRTVSKHLLCSGTTHKRPKGWVCLLVAATFLHSARM
jgi:hypothetical protein